MSWVKWLKGEKPGQEAQTPDASTAGATRASRQRGRREAYAREWVKVLEDSGPNRDPNGTWTWELHTDQLPKPASEGAGEPARRTTAQPAEPYDTFTWELQEGESSDDPWGLHKPAEAAPKKRDGMNPYDTGLFNASWSGRFDKR